MNNDHDLTTPKSRLAPAIIVVAFVVGALVVLYLFSYGPATAAVLERRMSLSLYAKIYAPIIWLVSQSDFVDSLASRFVDLFLSGDGNGGQAESGCLPYVLLAHGSGPRSLGTAPSIG